MIKPTMILSLLLISPQVAASTPCPTCPKGYVASSLEEFVLSKQKTKNIDLKKMPFKKISKSLLNSQAIAGSSNPAKSPVQTIVNRTKQQHKNSQGESASNNLQSHAPKRDAILEVADAPSRQLRAPNSSLFQDQVNRNLRGTFDKNMAISTQLQNRKR